MIFSPPICITLQLATENFVFHFIANLYTFGFFTIHFGFHYLEQLDIICNLGTVLFCPNSRSPTNKLNSTNSKIWPYGTSLLTLLQYENCPFISTLYFLLFNWFKIHKIICPFIPWLLNLFKNFWWRTLLNTFWKFK